jgi:putative copper resistance protein D
MIFGLIVTRWLHWAVCILLTSSQVFRVYLLPRKEVTEERNVQLWRNKFLSGLNRFDDAAWTVALLSLVAWFAVTVWSMVGPDERFDISLLSTIAAQTQLGRVSITRLVILVLAGVCVFVLRRSNAAEKGRLLRLMAMGLLLLNLMMLALVGHASATLGPASGLRLAVDAVHLATASVWPGGLVLFALLLRSVIAAPSSDLRALAARTTRRFSACSVVAVAVLAITGLATSFFFIHDPGDLWKTTYGQLITAKVLVFGGMTALGAQNLLVLKQRVELEAHLEKAGQEMVAVKALFRNVVWEVGLGALIILIVAVLGITEPPQH